MSLINDMLRDLDARQAADDEIGGLDRNVRALPPKPQRRLYPVALVIASALVGGVAVWLLQRPQTAHVPVVATPVTPPAAVPVAVSAPVSAPVSASVPAPPAAPAQTTSPAAMPPTTPAVAAPPAPTPTARTTAPAKRAPRKAKPKQPVAPIVPPLSPLESVPPLSAISVQPVKTSPADTGTPHISKEPALSGTPTEQADVEYRRGLSAIQNGNTDDADAAFRAALRISPAHVGARQALLGLLIQQKRWSDAETLALDGVDLLPQHSEWALLAARLMYQRSDPQGALDTLDRDAAHAGHNAEYQVLRAILLQGAGRNANAVNCYRTALTLRPNESRWWYGLGRALDADHRAADALNAYEKARDIGNLPPDMQQALERRLRQAP